MISLTLILLIIATILGVINYKKLTPQYKKLFVVYLVFNLVMEMIATNVASHHGNNLGVYNVSLSVELLVFLFIFYHALERVPYKKTTLMFLYILAAFIVCNFLFIQKMKAFHSYTYTLGSLFLFISIGFYFVQGFKKIPLYNPFKDFLFWVGIGILFCYLLSYPFMSVFNFVFAKSVMLSRQMTFLTAFANCIAFFCYSIGFLCLAYQKKS